MVSNPHHPRTRECRNFFLVIVVLFLYVVILYRRIERDLLRRPHDFVLTLKVKYISGNTYNMQTRQERRAGPSSRSVCKADTRRKSPTRSTKSTVSKDKSQTRYSLRSNPQRHAQGCHQNQTERLNFGRRSRHPEEYPDLDLHHGFGSFLTRKNPVSKTVDTKIAQYWQLLGQNPTLLQYRIHDIGDQYRTAFREFFTAEPISLHGHVSDASNPALLTSLVCHLISRASASCEISPLNEAAKNSPRIAVTEGSYGAAYGSLAYNAVVDTFQPVANGLRPVVIKINNTAKIDAQVKAAKGLGCVALMTEIVNAREGKVFSESAWKSLLKACERYKMILVVDEALTSIRCGAPFAYQLPQYSKHGLPDLVLFGKAIRTNGIAIEWRGINIKRLGIDNDESRLFTILGWQECFTEMAQAADLLISWGTLVLALREQWPQRAIEIGRLLRHVLVSDGIRKQSITGLHSLIVLQSQDNARFASPVMGAQAGKYVRWLPAMDLVMTSEDELLSKLFGPGSIPHRKEISAYLQSQDLRLGFCSQCGNAVDADVVGCEVCVVRKCEECEPAEHVCSMEG